MTPQSFTETCPEIIFIQNPILRTKTKDVQYMQGLAVGNYLIKIFKKYISITSTEQGLSAPQVGENSSVFITYIQDTPKIYINPRIIKKSKEQNLYRESCLSCTPFSVDVKRSTSITIEYTDEYGNFNIQEAAGVLARLLQHECDHLEGILNIDIKDL